MLMNMLSGNCPSFNKNSHFFGVVALLFHMGIALARQPLPDSLLPSCPTGIELSGVAVLVLEDILEASRKGLQLTPSLVIAAGALMVSWSLRAPWRLLSAAPGHVCAPLFMAPALS